MTSFLQFKKLFNQTKIILLFILLGLFILFSILVYSKTTNTSLFGASPKTSQESNPEYFAMTQRIRSLGGKRAYADLKKQYSRSNMTNRHAKAHLFGEALYNTEGIESMTVCDQNLSYGCYHGFIITALLDKGEDFIPELNQICVNRFGTNETGCRHGIGHGLVEYFGRDEISLKKALDICISLQKPSPLGCTQGVFMEYNHPGVNKTGNTIINVRKLESEDKIHEPCSHLSSELTQSCYYQLSQWWVSLFDDFKKAGALCEGIDKSIQKACYRGLGVAATYKTFYDAEKTIDRCKEIPDEAYHLDCLATATWVYKVETGSNNGSEKLCKALPTQSQEKCLDESIPTNQVIF